MTITDTAGIAARPEEPDSPKRDVSELAPRFQLMDAHGAVACLLKAADSMAPNFPDLAFEIAQVGIGIKVQLDDRLSGRQRLRARKHERLREVTSNGTTRTENADAVLPDLHAIPDPGTGSRAQQARESDQVAEVAATTLKGTRRS